VAAASGGGMALTAGGMTLVGAASELVLAARLVIAGCKTNPALCLNQAGIYAADIVAPEAIIGTGAVTTGSTLILGKTEDSVKKLSRQLVNVFDEFYKTKTFNTQPVAGFIKGETAAGANLSTKTADYVKSLQKDNTAKLVSIFNKQNPNAELNVFGKPLQQVLGPGGSDTRGKIKVFASEKLTEDEIISFATSLTGGIPFKEQILPDGRLMYVKINDNQTIKQSNNQTIKQSNNQTINLRDFSASAEKTGARWTIEIIGNSDIKTVSKTSLNRFEVKFR
jgi:filamentous hemagglutinin